MFHEIEDFSQFYFNEVDKIATGSFYKTLKLWKLYSVNKSKYDAGR